VLPRLHSKKKGSEYRGLLSHDIRYCGRSFLRNLCIYLLNYTASYARVSTVTYWREQFCPWRRVRCIPGLNILVLSKA